MSDSLGFFLAVVVAEIAPAALGLYAAYWALSIRRALAMRIYRRHALWLGVVCVLVSSANFVTYSDNIIINDLINAFFSIVVGLLFAFIDSTVQVARRSDPLLRTILKWEKLRIVGWTGVAALATATAIFIIVPMASPAFPNSPAGLLVGNILGTVDFVAIAVPFVTGAPALLVGARRSRDPVLRGSLKWLGVAIALLVVSIVQGFVLLQYEAPGASQFDQFYSYAAIPGGIISILGSYALYRSARSLAPINRLLAAESEMVTAPSASESL